MKRLGLVLLKVLAPIFLLGVAFFPQYGAAWYIFSNFTSMPALWVVIIAVWLGLLALNLPLRQDQFRMVTTASILAISGAIIFVLGANGSFDYTSMNAWGVAAIVVVGFILGWWTISVPLLRWWRGLFATDANDQPIEG
jgi:hypothetical protein